MRLLLLSAFVALLATAPAPAADPPGVVDSLYDPTQVAQIDLEASAAALAELAAAPDEYVEARITLRIGGTTYGPYPAGIRLKGHATFRTLEGKAAFKVKFKFAGGQPFYGLKSLTLNNMTQDPSMIAEATSALLIGATGAPVARVGYAYVRLNGADYGLYADVETIDSVMAKRWFAGTQHLYEANFPLDVTPGREGEFEVDEGSETDLSDLTALMAANAGGTGSWWERMQRVADLSEVTRIFAAEHYIGHWDGYSVSAQAAQPTNYYLQSDLAGRFSLLASGTDQTWLERPSFGVYGIGVLMRHCVLDVTCRQLYVDALRQLVAAPALAALPAQVRAMRAVIAPWRALDPRREQTVAEGEAQADTKIATVDARAAELIRWLANPAFIDATEPAGGGNDSTDTPGAPPPVAIPTPQAPTAQPPTPQAPTAQAIVMRPLLGRPVVLPAKPVAGHRFRFSLRVTRSDTGALLATGKMACDPSVAGKQIGHTDSFRAGRARLSFVVPGTAKGKLLKVKVAIVAAGKTAGHTYTYAIR